MNSNGSVLDIAFFITVIFATALILIFAFNLLGSLTGEFQDSSAIDTSNGTAANNTLARADQALVALDSMIPLVFILLGFMTVALGFLLPSQPIFAVFSFIALSVTALISTVFANVFFSVGQIEALSASASRMTFTSFIMQNMLLLTVVFGIATIIAMYISSGDVGVRR